MPNDPLREALKELLKMGQHDGPCDNEIELPRRTITDGACTLHLAASAKREEAARAALASPVARCGPNCAVGPTGTIHAPPCSGASDRGETASDDVAGGTSADAALRRAEDAILHVEARSDENGGSAASIVDCLKAVRDLRDPALVAKQFTTEENADA